MPEGVGGNLRSRYIAHGCSVRFSARACAGAALAPGHPCGPGPAARVGGLLDVVSVRGVTDCANRVCHPGMLYCLPVFDRTPGSIERRLLRFQFLLAVLAETWIPGLFCFRAFSTRPRDDSW